MTFGIASTGTIEENLISDRCAGKRCNSGIFFTEKEYP